MDALLLVLGLPLLGALILALCGHRDFAPEVNVGFSLSTLVAAVILTQESLPTARFWSWISSSSSTP